MIIFLKLEKFKLTHTSPCHNSFRTKLDKYSITFGKRLKNKLTKQKTLEITISFL